MTDVAKKKPLLPSLKRSSLSGNLTLEADSEALLEPTETSGSDGVRIKTSRIDSVLEVSVQMGFHFYNRKIDGVSSPMRSSLT